MIYAMAPSDPAALGARIRRAREARHMTQQQLAGAIGVSVRTVGDWERGRVSQIRNRLGALEEFFGVSFDSSAPVPFVPADDDEARIWAMDEPVEWKLEMIALVRQAKAQRRAAS